MNLERPRKIDLREVVAAIRYIVRCGILGRALPACFPKWKNVAKAIGQASLEVLSIRKVVVRIMAWTNFYHRLIKDHERTVEDFAAWVLLGQCLSDLKPINLIDSI